MFCLLLFCNTSGIVCNLWCCFLLVLLIFVYVVCVNVALFLWSFPPQGPCSFTSHLQWLYKPSSALLPAARLHPLINLLYFPPPLYQPVTCGLSHHVSHLQNTLFMHACMPAHTAYVSSQNKLANTRSMRVLLGGKSAPRPPHPPLYNNKNREEVWSIPSLHRS